MGFFFYLGGTYLEVFVIFFNGIVCVASSVLADISCFQFCWWTSVVFLPYRDQLRSSPSFML